MLRTLDRRIAAFAIGFDLDVRAWRLFEKRFSGQRRLCQDGAADNPDSIQIDIDVTAVRSAPKRARIHFASSRVTSSFPPAFAMSDAVRPASSVASTSAS